MANYQTFETLLDALVSALGSGRDLRELLANYHDLKRGYRIGPDGPEIPLTQGHWSKISDEDLERVLQHKWFAIGEGNLSHPVTARSKIAGRAVMLSRFILGLHAGNPLVADHINYDNLDNRRANLRAVTRTESAQHRRGWSRQAGAGPKSQYKGVSWRPDNARWRAVIKHLGRPISLGDFANENDAAVAYDNAARIYHGDFAELNFG